MLCIDDIFILHPVSYSYSASLISEDSDWAKQCHFLFWFCNGRPSTAFFNVGELFDEEVVKIVKIVTAVSVQQSMWLTVFAVYEFYISLKVPPQV